MSIAWRDLRALMDASLKEVVTPVLRGKGFKGSLPHFRRPREGKVDVLGFQFSQFGPQFYMEIGICPEGGITLPDGSHVTSNKVKYYQCEKRRRIGLQPFNFEKGQFEFVACSVVQYLQQAEKWWHEE
jgi:hypothetical protein